MADGREPDTGLGHAVIEHFGSLSLRSLCDDVHSGRTDRRALAASAAVVARRCDDRDPAALQIRTQASNHLCELARSAARRCGRLDEVWAIRLAGGLFSDDQFVEEVVARLRDAFTGIESAGQIERIDSAECGAARLAAERLE